MSVVFLHRIIEFQAAGWKTTGERNGRGTSLPM